MASTHRHGNLFGSFCMPSPCLLVSTTQPPASRSKIACYAIGEMRLFSCIMLSCIHWYFVSCHLAARNQWWWAGVPVLIILHNPALLGRVAAVDDREIPESLFEQWGRFLPSLWGNGIGNLGASCTAYCLSWTSAAALTNLVWIGRESPVHLLSSEACFPAYIKWLIGLFQAQARLWRHW